jgi:hypothetical protein
MTNDEQDQNLESSQAQGPSFRSDDLGQQKGTPPSALANPRTGPRSQLGKNISKRNALKHAIFSKALVLKGESQAEVNFWVRGLHKYYQPEGALEDILVDKVMALFLRLRRIIRAEIDAGGVTTVNPFDLGENLTNRELLIRYETMLERNIDRTLAQLKRAQRIRLGHPVPPRIDINVSSL